MSLIYKLVDCTSDFTYYVTENSNLSYPLSGYVGKVVSLTAPQSLTGLPFDVESCFFVFQTTGTSPGVYNLGTITNFGVNACDGCSIKIGLRSCDTGVLYTVRTHNADVIDLIDTCPTLCNFCQPSIRITVSNPNNDPGVPPTGCYSVEPPNQEAINLDFYNPVFVLTCNPSSPCLICEAKCYLVTPCDGSSPFILTDPEPLGYPTIVLDTVVEVVVNAQNFSFKGCVTITLLDSCNPVSNNGTLLFPIYQVSTITFDSPPVTYQLCDNCFPPVGYMITRCDDPAISFTVSTNLSTQIGSVITGVTILGCSGVQTVSLCSSVLKSQCWQVSAIDTPGDYQILWTDVYANCDCCYKPCN